MNIKFDHPNYYDKLRLNKLHFSIIFNKIKSILTPLICYINATIRFIFIIFRGYALI